MAHLPVNYCHLAVGLFAILATMLLPTILAQSGDGNCAADCGSGLCETVVGVGDTCVCNTGYKLDSSGLCTVLESCSSPGVPNMAVITSGSATTSTYSDEITYACNTGYELTSGSLLLTCGAGGTWSGTVPTCSIVSCGAAEAGLNTVAVSVPSTTTYSDTVVYECATGNVLRSGSLTRTCQADKTWSDTAPICSVSGGCLDNFGVCQNGGACSDTATGYTCSCSEGTEGTNCEIVTEPAVRSFSSQVEILNADISDADLNDPSSSAYQYLLRTLPEALGMGYRKSMPVHFRGFEDFLFSRSPNGNILASYTVKTNMAYTGTPADLARGFNNVLIDSRWLDPVAGQQYLVNPDTLSANELATFGASNMTPLIAAMALGIPLASVLCCGLAAAIRRRQRHRRGEETESMDDDTDETRSFGVYSATPIFAGVPSRHWQDAPATLADYSGVNAYDNRDAFNWAATS